MIVFRPRDPLDLAEASRLLEALEALPPGARVHVDLSAVRDVPPTSLAALGRALDRDGRVTLGGLRRHHERLLAYLRAAPPAPSGEARRPGATASAAVSAPALEP